MADHLPGHGKVTEMVQVTSLLDPSVMLADISFADMKQFLMKHATLAHDRLSHISAAAATVVTTTTRKTPAPSTYLHLEAKGGGD